jgi:lipid-A-disaccharide synthase-like uncharacterized protein
MNHPSHESSLLSQLERWFLFGAVGLLLFTATVKLISATQEIPFLSSADPLFAPLSNRQITLLVAALELLIVGIILRGPNRVVKLSAVAWLATLFCTYRLGLWLINYHGPCSCLGGAVDWLTRNKLVVLWGLRGMLAYLLVFSYSFLVAELSKRHSHKGSIPLMAEDSA